MNPWNHYNDEINEVNYELPPIAEKCPDYHLKIRKRNYSRV